jgi:hypothetical protein
MACAAGSDASAGRILRPGMMNSKNEAGSVELLLLAAMALGWAVLTVLRAVLVPLIALAVVLLTPRRPAPEPAAPASDEAPAPAVATHEAAPTLADMAADLMELPATELRRLAGTRRRLPKAQLAALICAMPI